MDPNPRSSLRFARPEEAPRIHALLTEAFADGLLPYTVYRSPKSVGRLAALAAEGRIRTIDDGEGVAIFTGAHLDYLVVAKAARGRGFGRVLLEDFHCGQPRTTLDLSADEVVRDFYERIGYVEQGESLCLRLALDGKGSEPETWARALTEEAQKGFSAVGHAGMRVGLLGGTTLRLLDAGERSVEEALAILSLIGFAGRTEIVLTGLTCEPEGYRTIHRLRSRRMERNTA